MLYISIGQGMGSSIVINGQVFQGSQGLAGEIGHTSINIDSPLCKCGNHGCLDVYASSLALIKRVKEVLKLDNVYRKKLIYHLFVINILKMMKLLKKKYCKSFTILPKGLQTMFM